jgi:hypothetical protein
MSILQGCIIGDVCSSVTTHEISLPTSFEVYPNPFTSEVHLHLSNSQGQLKELEIFDVMAHKVLELKWEEEDLTIDLLSLKQGIYFIKIKSFEYNFIRKIIK